MLSPGTGDGARPRIGRSGEGGVVTSRGFALGDALSCGSCGVSAVGDALALLPATGEGAFFGSVSLAACFLSAGNFFSAGEGCPSALTVCFFLSSASSD